MMDKLKQEEIILSKVKELGSSYALAELRERIEKLLQEYKEELDAALDRYGKYKGIVEDMKGCIEGLPLSLCIDDPVCGLTEDDLGPLTKAIKEYFEVGGESPPGNTLTHLVNKRTMDISIKVTNDHQAMEVNPRAGFNEVWWEPDKPKEKI